MAHKEECPRSLWVKVIIEASANQQQAIDSSFYAANKTISANNAQVLDQCQEGRASRARKKSRHISGWDFFVHAETFRNSKTEQHRDIHRRRIPQRFNSAFQAEVWRTCRLCWERSQKPILLQQETRAEKTKQKISRWLGKKKQRKTPGQSKRKINEALFYRKKRQERYVNTLLTIKKVQKEVADSTNP